MSAYGHDYRARHRRRVRWHHRGEGARRARHQSRLRRAVRQARRQLGLGQQQRVSAACKSLHIDTPLERMEFSDILNTVAVPDFARRDPIAAYVRYIASGDRIRFRTGVKHVQPGTPRVGAISTDLVAIEARKALKSAAAEPEDDPADEPLDHGDGGGQGAADDGAKVTSLHTERLPADLRPGLPDTSKYDRLLKPVATTTSTAATPKKSTSA
ncbi:hypothetical protein [Streptomyces sp. NPDC046727]|uniref:hypothetical protein n=1 Tax=Streptomyces sp. NPDC046727 TaxID=3155373 RepID=UPI00340EF72B